MLQIIARKQSPKSWHVFIWSVLVTEFMTAVPSTTTILNWYADGWFVSSSVCVLYRSQIHTKVNELRWLFYSNRAAERENLPSTSGSRGLAYSSHTLHSHGSSHFSPVRCLNAPAPEAVLYLIKCRCKSGCERRCSCHINNIPCTEVCGCWVFTCNNKTSQRGINDECEDDWCTLLKLQLYTMWLFIFVRS